MNMLDTLVVLICAFLVLMMYPGLSLFYSGMTRSKNVLSTMLLCYACLFIVSIQWIFVGYSFTFSPSLGGLGSVFGNTNWFFLNNVSLLEGNEYSGGIPGIVHMFYQMMFAGLAVAIIVGSVIERIKFSAFILFTILWTTLVYDPLAHSFWAVGGILEDYGVLDYAGGSVIHVSAGISGLILAIFLGKRRGNDYGIPHNLPSSIFGATLLFIGWFGFNAGNAMSLNSEMLLVIINTHIAGCVGALTWMILDYVLTKKVTALGAISGLISGLVAITPACAFVTLTSAIVIGGISSILCYLGVYYLKHKLDYDDSLDAFGIHGIGGLWGGLAVGVFGSHKINNIAGNGLIYGEWTQFIHQLVGTIVTIAFVTIGTIIIVLIVKYLCKGLRVNSHEEEVGLDISLHGEKAYHEN